MNRRSTLSLLLGKQKKSEKKTIHKAASTVSFDPYNGPWNFEQAAHLLRRTVFGASKTQIEQAVADGLQTSIANLFQNLPLPSPPVYYDFEDDPNIDLGESWIDDQETEDVDGLRGARIRSMYAWSFIQMTEGGVNIREKMTLFWHNHFVVRTPLTGRRMYKYINLLRANATGNFRSLVEGITIDPSMLVYLNGTQNSDNGPNENYSRELLELFTIGKGPIAGPGDYTNYTEDDVVAIARALTGWRAFNAANNNDTSESAYQANRHDIEDKQLSNRFDNIVITNGEEEEYKTVIDIILQKDETARFICRKLYRWFVHADISPEVEVNVIEPMAQMVIADNYEISNALMALLSSECFYDFELRGCMVSHPLEHWYKLINSFEMALPTEEILKYKIAKHFHSRLRTTEMDIFRHPNVAGWTAFYQAPQFDKLWINAVSLPVRQGFADRFISGYNNNQFRLEIDVLTFTAALDNPINAEDLINEIAAILFAHILTEEQVIALKDILIPGLPDYEWTIEYGDYIGGDDSLEEAVENKLKALIGTMVNMPEFYLI